MRISDWSSDVCSSDLSSFTQTFGWSATDVIGLSADEIGLWDASGSSLQRIERVIRERSLNNVAVVVHHKNGQPLTCVISSRQKIGRASCRERGCQYV